MAHNKQALKRARQNERIRVKNRAMRADMRTHMKAFEAAVAAKDATTVAQARARHPEEGGQGREAAGAPPERRLAHQGARRPALERAQGRLKPALRVTRPAAVPAPLHVLLAFGSQPAPEGPPHHERGRLDLRGHAAQAQPGQPPRRAVPAGADGNRIAPRRNPRPRTRTAGTPTSGSSSTTTRP